MASAHHEPPLHASVGDLAAESDVEDFQTPAAPDGIQDCGLRARTVKQSVRPRRRHTLPIGDRPAPFPARTRLQAALRRVRRLEYPGLEPLSQESLVWDNSAQALVDPLGINRLWSSSTASTQFDVTVAVPEKPPSDMASGDASSSDLGLGLLGFDERGVAIERQQVGQGNGNGLNSETHSLASTIRPRRIPTPAPRTSRPGTPLLPDGATAPPASQHPRSVTPVLQLRPLPLQHVQLSQLPDPAMSVWHDQVDRAIQEAEDLVLPYRGAQVRRSVVRSIRSEAERITRVLRHCFPHCDLERKAIITAYRKDITEVCVTLAEMSFDSSLSTRGDPPFGPPSAASSPRSTYNAPQLQLLSIAPPRTSPRSIHNTPPGHNTVPPVRPFPSPRIHADVTSGRGFGAATDAPPQTSGLGPILRDPPQAHNTGGATASAPPQTGGLGAIPRDPLRAHNTGGATASVPPQAGGQGPAPRKPPRAHDLGGATSRPSCDDYRDYSRFHNAPDPSHDRDHDRSRFNSRDRQGRHDSPRRHASPRYRSSRFRSSSPPVAALEFERLTLLFLLGLIDSNALPEVDIGSGLDPETIKELHDVRVPEIKGAIRECRDAAGKYASRRGSDAVLIQRALVQCQRAYEWTRQVVDRYRGDQHHLAGNAPTREPTFTAFDPNGDVNVYEFFMRYEEWSRGYISYEARAHLLFSKYLPKSLTESYEELRTKKGNYNEMKNWLIDQYGMLKGICDGKIRSIRGLNLPKSDDDLLGHSQYLRSIHKSVTTLYGLELHKGTRVPGLREHMESNTFLMQLSEVLPKLVQQEWSKFLAKSGVTTWKVEGKVYLDKILDILQEAYLAKEIQARLPGNEPPAKPKAKAGHTNRDKSPDPAHASVVTPNSPKQKGNRRDNRSNPKQQKDSGDSSTKTSRWSCPMEGHERHELGECKRFFQLTVKERRAACRYQACWTCLARRDSQGNCKRGECSRLKKVPVVLICQGCVVSNNQSNPPLSIFLCGLTDHKKPDEKTVGEALEKWIPGFKVQGLGTPIVLGLSTMHASPASQQRPKCKTTPPTSRIPMSTFDTRDGSTRRISQNDPIFMPSKEESFFIMQQLRIGGEEVLTFYDSGANVHLVEGSLAEKVGFTVLDDRCVSIGVVGGSRIWTEYGQYACVLGPDANQSFHQIECQGLERITSTVPEFDLRPLRHEATPNFQYGNQMVFPLTVGGDRVKLLIGIRSTNLAPRLHCSLPNGLGVYISALVDVHGSNICFGGTHEIFTKGYARAGMSAGHIQVLFTQVAQAYMRAPYTTVRSKSDDHGPPQKQPVAFLTDDQWTEEVEDMFGSRAICAPVPDVVPDCHCQDQGICDYGGRCHKATIPLSKLKGLLDEDDIPVIKDTRCEKCANCPTCKLSSRAKTQSLQEAFEQEVIEGSVAVDLEDRKVRVDLPFVKQPVEFLTKRHKRNDNLPQALTIYRSQCRKPEEVKVQIRSAQQELVDKGFMVPLSTLPMQQQEIIKTASFRHYYPWRAVYKPGSVSTPCRLVVDPSCTGLNIILAKGENMLAQIPDILIRLRTQRSAWTTDISKLYNRLHLQDSALPYSLFLYDPTLSDNVKPEVWVMTRAWYGVSSTGNQATVALRRLAELGKNDYPLAFDLLTRDIYVDDVAGGADSAEAREEQIRQAQIVLGSGGFSMKFVARSGHPPPAGSSSDGRTVGCLGLTWDTAQDQLSPSILSMNLQKKIRGQKAAPDRDVTTQSGLRSALKDGLITKAGVLSRTAEFFDPVGWWEPLRLQMKLSFQELNSLDWKDPVPEHLHDTWVDHFSELENSKALTIPRCIIPPSAPSDWKMRLLCLADAGEGAGGAAIYGGIEKPDGTYTCNLLFAKSRLMRHTVPRNELEAIVLMADIALVVQQSLGDRVGDVLFYTDSRVAQCWVLNTRKRLRMFVHNRVQAARHGIRLIVDSEETLPLYHIEGTENLADMITKPRKLLPSDLTSTSKWMTGLEWMTQPTADLPRSQYLVPEDSAEEQLVSGEVFPDVENYSLQVEARECLLTCGAPTLDEQWSFPHFTDPPPTPPSPVPPDIITVSYPPGHPDSSDTQQETDKEQHIASSVYSGRVGGGGEPEWLEKTFKFLHFGWARALKRLEAVFRITLRFRHVVHKDTEQPVDGCPVCSGQEDQECKNRALQLVTLTASTQAEKSFGKSRLQKQCSLQGGIWYATQRLGKEGLLDTADLDFEAFFDGVSIKKVLPVIPVESKLFQSLVLHIHFKEFPHQGVEATLARLRQTFYPLGDARRMITFVKKSCSKCRILLKQVVGLELADIHPARTTIAPPFYAVQMDIAMGFKARPMNDSRKSFTAHALVVVCLLTSATSIMVMDGLTTQTVVMALERHASRYGMPAFVYVDSGTQLEKLNDTHFSLRHVNGWESHGKRFTVKVVTPKAHQQQGRVESKIKVVRHMLQSLSDTAELVNTLLGWETMFLRIADQLDNLPIARGSSRAPTDLGWEVITPNRLKLGRNNFRQLEGTIILSNAPQSQLERNRLIQERWYDLFVQRIHLLIPKAERVDTDTLQPDDVVLFVFQDPGIPKMWVWRLGIIVSQVSRTTYEIRYVSQVGSPPRTIMRDARHISLIHKVDEIPPMSSRFLENRTNMPSWATHCC